MYTSGDIKREAKAQLEGHWRAAIMLSFIPILIALVFASGTAMNPFYGTRGSEISSILMSFIQSFLTLGVSFTLLDFLRNHDSLIEPLKGIFHAFKGDYFLNLLLLQLSMYVRIFLWSLLLVVPGIIKAYAYSQAVFIYKDTVDRTGEQPSPKECLEESERLMDGHKMALFRLSFSFIGWAFLCLMTLGIGLIWLVPYINMSLIIFYDNIAGNRYLGNEYNEEDDMYRANERDTYNLNEEVGQDPDDFSDFEDF